MGTDRDLINGIRAASFPMVRRGYDRRAVDHFLGQLADWLDRSPAEPAKGDAVRSELERIGERTAKVLTEAHAAAQELVAEAEREASRTRSEADAYAERARIDAETYAREQRDEADSYGAGQRAEIDARLADLRSRAQAEAEEITAGVARRRQALEAEVRELAERRREVVEGMKRLSSELAGTATEHESGGGDFDDAEFADGDFEVYEGIPDDDDLESGDDEVENGDDALEGEDEVGGGDEPAQADAPGLHGETVEFDVEREFAHVEDDERTS